MSAPVPTSGWLGELDVSIITPDDALDRVADAVASRIAAPVASPWLDSRAAVEYLRLPSLDALHRLTAAGAVPHVKQGGRCLFHRAELDDWLRDHYAGPPRCVSTAFPSPQKAA